MKEYKFEVGKSYFTKYGRIVKCTKRTDCSVWFDNVRYVITSHDPERTNYHSSRDINDETTIRERNLEELLKIVRKTCDHKPNEYSLEKEEEIYGLCSKLEDALEEIVELE